MFTGIITATEPVKSTEHIKQGVRVAFGRPDGWADLVLGESIAVNGVCLTIESLDDDTWSAVMIPETLAKTSFHNGLPHVVNLERALPLTERLSGHIVQGHVDGVGKVVSVRTDNEYVISIEFPAADTSLVIYKGSITVNGVSLTVSSCKDNVLEVSLIPHTLQSTTLGDLKPNDLVNLEFDVVGKYVTKFLKEHYATR